MNPVDSLLSSLKISAAKNDDAATPRKPEATPSSQAAVGAGYEGYTIMWGKVRH
jgi:hypothetical protein